MVHSFPASLLKRPLDIPKGGAFVVYRRKKAERVGICVKEKSLHLWAGKAAELHTGI